MGGDGSIYRRKDGRWVAAISRGPRGARRVYTRYLPRTGTKPEARALLAELSASIGAGAPRTLTVSAYLDSWVRDARNIRPRTRDAYANSVRHHLAPAIGALRLVDLGPLDVERLLTELEAKRSPATARHAHATLRRALGQAVRMGLVTRNVASRQFVDAPRLRRTDPDALSLEETDAIFEALLGSGIEAHAFFALGTGLRQGEQLGLTWGDIGADAVRVERELARLNGRYELVDPKTERSRRMVPLSELVQAAIGIHREQLAERGFMAVASGPVFPNRSGGALNGSWLTHQWYAVLEKAGVRRRPWKILRATFASRLHDAGVPDRVIADLMGHERTHTTQNSYISTRAVDAGAAVALVFDSHGDSHGMLPKRGQSGPNEGKSGEPRRTRTFNQLIKSQLLYH
ncbi:MAG: hypothetical protein QOJ81_1317 [Chloroflexota bacterium]|nr:hypothetical protein [Chloroflexota bacterium]